MGEDDRVSPPRGPIFPHNSIFDLKNTYLKATYGADFWFQFLWFFDKLRMFFGDMFVLSTVGVESHVAFREHWAFPILKPENKNYQKFC